MTEITVTAEDKRAAWDAFFARTPGLEHIPVLAPEDVPDPSITLAALERVLIADRLRRTSITSTEKSAT